MQDVYVVISILNGYKNVEGVYKDRKQAEEFAKRRKADWHFEEHDFRVITYPLY